jgi:hypothetical protein
MSEIKQAQEATEKANAKGEQAATDMFQLQPNLLSIDTKYAWNKIVHKQTTSDPYTDLQGFYKKGLRGLLHKSFNDCMIALPHKREIMQLECYISRMKLWV